MIIFYNKKDGKIIGTIDGRVNTEEHLKMWVGDKIETERIIIDWKPNKLFDEKGKKTLGFEPDHPQKSILKEFEEKPSEVYKYKIDLKTKQLVKQAK